MVVYSDSLTSIFSFTIIFLRFTYADVCSSSPFILIALIIHNLLICSPLDDICFKFLQLTNNVTMNILLQFSWYTKVRDSVGYLPMNEIARSKGMCIFSFTQYCFLK